MEDPVLMCQLLDEYENYGTSHDVKTNANKSVVMFYSDLQP